MVVQELCPIFICSPSGHWKSQVSFSELKWGSYVIIFLGKIWHPCQGDSGKITKNEQTTLEMMTCGDAGCCDVHNGYFATLLKELVTLEISKYFWDWLRKQYHLISFNWLCFMLVQCIYGFHLSFTLYQQTVTLAEKYHQGNIDEEKKHEYWTQIVSDGCYKLILNSFAV